MKGGFNNNLIAAAIFSHVCLFATVSHFHSSLIFTRNIGSLPLVWIPIRGFTKAGSILE